MIGQSVGSNASPLSCFLFRPRKSCEKRRIRSHINASNASVTRTSRVSQTPLQTPIPYFHQWVPHGKKALVAIACKTAHVRFHERKRVHTRLCSKDRTQRLTRRNRGCFGWGRYYYPRRIPHVHEHPRAGYQNGVLCRFWALVGGALEEHRKPSEQRCAYACRCPEGVAAPLGCVICLQFGDVAVFSLCAQYFLNVRGRGVLLPSACFTCC